MGRYVAGCAIAATTALFGCIAGAGIGEVFDNHLDAQRAAQGLPADPNGAPYTALFGAFLGAIFTPAVTLTVIAFFMSRAEERERERKWIEEHESRRMRSQSLPSAPPPSGDLWD